VIGCQQPVRVHELLAPEGVPVASEQKEMLRLYAMALSAYRERCWHDALELFRQCLVLWPDDAPSLVMQHRCLRFRVEPPPLDWGGMFDQVTK
jgi:adenylate cyclase